MGLTHINGRAVKGMGEIVSPSPVSRPKKSPTTLCIITSHNYGRFLGECIQSCRWQTLPFARIVVVDDSSSDCTAEVAAACGVDYIRGEWRDVAKARNAGVVGWSDFLLFVDADNVLTPGFHAQLVEGMDRSDIGVTYSHMHRVSEAGESLGLHTGIRPFNRHHLERVNLADTCSLIRREAFEQVGGWWGEKSGLEDWSLWLKIVRSGWRMRLMDMAEFYYRVHAQQMSKNTPGREGHTVRCIEAGQTVVIVGIFGGRPNLEAYFSAIAQLDWAKENLHIVAIDNSAPEQWEYRDQLQALLIASGLSFTYRREASSAVPGVTAAELSDSPELRRQFHWELQMHITRLYALAKMFMPASAALILSLEDDIELPPETLRQMVRVMANESKVGIVAALVPNRFTPGYIAWTGPSMRERRRIRSFGEEPVIAVTFACTLIRREVWDLAFHPQWDAGRSHGEAAFDWSFGQDARAAGWSIRLVNVLVKHAGRTDSGWVKC